MADAAPLLLTYKYRLNPERRQHRALERILEQQRQLYNAALEERIECYRKTGKSISEVDQSRSLTVIRGDDAAFARVQRRIQRGTLKRLDRSYKSFFRRAKAGAGASSGFPKFKGREHFDSFSFDAFAQVSLDGDRLRFSGMPGALKVSIDRPLPVSSSGVPEIKNMWFKREGRRWYCGLQVEVLPRANRNGLGKRAVGVDWGTFVLAALSTGEMIDNPRHGEALQKDLARAQRAIARKKLGSKRRRKARVAMQAVQAKIANRRRNTMDKLSARLVKQFSLVAFEKIDAKSLMNAEKPGESIPVFIKRRRNREALDAAPHMMRQMIAYKAKRELAEFVEIDPTAIVARDNNMAQPTQRCSLCGKLHFKTLADDHVCTTPNQPFHNIRLPRKVNAARVILHAAMGDYGTLSPADRDRGGPVPGGAKRRVAAVGLGNTESGRPLPVRRRVNPGSSNLVS